jgi:mono/diheme cytochrome c family protein
LWQDAARDWTRYQGRFANSLSRSERRGLGGGLAQFHVQDLHRVDRCTTCHVAIAKPTLALAEQPFTAHPGDYLASHPPEKFGCTVCHGGQGLATDVKAAHGDVKHWEEPLLRGNLVQASCRKCHGDLDAIAPQAPQLIKGMELYRTLGCAGCHAVHGFGQTVSIDLSDVGDKPWQLLDFTFVEGAHTLPVWIEEHFKEPRRVTPGFRLEELPKGEEEIYPSFMPDYGLGDEDVRALTIYMLSLTEETLPASYVVPGPPKRPEPMPASSVEAGRAVFEKYGCTACHGLGGAGGRHNWNAVYGEEAPALVFAKSYYPDRESLKQMIRDGRQPTPRLDMSRPRPPLYMPAWKERIPEPELEALIDYLLSLSEQLPEPPQPAESEDANSS